MASASPSMPATGQELLYVVEDDSDIARLVQHHLQQGGYAVRLFGSGMYVIEEARRERPRLFLLDIMIPGPNGLDLCRQIRRNELLRNALIVFLTAKGTEAERVHGLESGADDYISKPFSPRELVARVRALLRRGQESLPSVVTIGHLEIDSPGMSVKVHGQKIATTAREFQLLDYLIRNAGRVFTRDQLLDAVWGDTSHVTSRSIDVYVRRIRKKIELEPDQPRYLKTVHGAGYRFDVPE
jgi:DNA-binding response OmpR family regulator